MTRPWGRGIYKRGKSWVISMTIDGRRYRRSLGECSEQEAREALEEIKKIKSQRVLKERKSNILKELGEI